jgi:hypothetical protein
MSVQAETRRTAAVSGVTAGKLRLNAQMGPKLSDGLGDRFGIKEVVLVRFPIRLHKLCRDQSHLVSLLAQYGAQTMRSGTCLQTD